MCVCGIPPCKQDSLTLEPIACLVALDILHSYMGVAGLALMGEPGIQPLDPLLNISRRMEQRLYTQSVFWKDSA